MKAILLKRVEKLGQMGDVVDVAPGYFRNYLYTRGFADRATPERLEWFKTQRTQLEADNLKTRQEAEKVGQKMDGLILTFIRAAGETGHLFGSVRTQDIAEELTKQGYTVSRSQIVIEHPIKMLGLHTVYISLHAEVRVPLTLNIAMSDEEALRQLRAEEKSAEKKTQEPPVEEIAAAE
jgi:large subunit ribosomal protein L9